MNEFIKEYLVGDVVIVGSGAAGLSAAVEIKKYNPNISVIIIEKGLFAKSGSSVMARRFIAYSFRLEKIPKWRGGTAANFMWIEDENLKKLIAELARPDSQAAWKLALELENLGCYFRRFDDGTLWIEPTVGLHSPITDRVGKMITRALATEAKNRGVKVFEETMALGVLTKNSIANGIVALDIRNNRLVIINSRAVILATGAAAWYPTSTVPDTLTGDGYVMALHAGAELADLCELVWYVEYKNPNITPKIWRFSIGAWTPRPLAWLGPKFLNRFGEDIFSKKEYEQILNEARKHGLDGKNLPIPLWLVTYIVAKEILSGRGTNNEGIYVSYKHLPEQLKSLMRETWETYEYFKKIGIDPTEELLEISYVPHTTCGGIVVDHKFETAVPRLFAIGGTIIHPTIKIDLVINEGKIVGKYIATHISDMELLPVDEDLIKMYEKKIYNYLERSSLRDAPRPAQVKRMIKDILQRHCYYWKEEKSMREGLEKLKRLREETLPQMSLSTNMIRSYNLELKEAFEAENLLELAEIFIEMALMKRESRGTFRRLDYPEESDTFTSVRVKLVNGKREYRVIKVPIPLE